LTSKRRTYTKRLAQKIIKEVLENDLHSVAKKGAVTTEQIERMLNDASDSSLSNLALLGIRGKKLSIIQIRHSERSISEA
jgi:hypothetical protein